MGGSFKLPPPQSRRNPAGEQLVTISVTVQVVTPFFGGGPVARTPDEVDVVRVPTVRGHLRFWWRAVNGSRFTDSRDLYRREACLWGAVPSASNKDSGRSAVDVRIEVRERSYLTEPGDPPYVLWPARTPAPGSSPGTWCKGGLQPAP